MDKLGSPWSRPPFLTKIANKSMAAEQLLDNWEDLDEAEVGAMQGKKYGSNLFYFPHFYSCCVQVV